MGSRSYNLVERGGTGLAFIEQVAGREKGRTFDLGGNRITIGRSDDNDIVIATEAVSRYHAVLERVEGGWLVRDNQSKNGVQVNGAKVEEAVLQSGDVVQVGSFVFRFNGTELTGQSQVSSTNVPLPNEPGEFNEEYAAPVEKKKGPNKRLLIYGVGALVLVLLYMIAGGDDKKTADEKTVDAAAATQKLARDAFSPAPQPDLGDKVLEKPESQEKIPVGKASDPANTQMEDPVLKKAEQDMEKLDWTNSSLRESEAFFRKGRREYMDHNYQRAIDDFQTSLTIYRGHELAEKYLQRTYSETEREAKHNMEMGVRYFEALQYQRAIYHFTQVISLLAHRPTEPLIKESEKYVEQAKRRLQSAELFP